MNKQMSIEELAEEANKVISKKTSISSDKRMSDTISVRRIRDYISKKMMDKPYKEGRNTYYVQLHLDQLLTLREFQSEGLTESYIQKLSTPSVLSENNLRTNGDNIFLSASGSTQSFSGSNDSALQNNALSLLAGMKQENSVPLSILESSRSIGGSRSAVSGYLSDQLSPKYNLDTKIMAISKTWIEHPLDTDGKIFIKMEAGAKISNPEKVLEQLKTILNIQ